MVLSALADPACRTTTKLVEAVASMLPAFADRAQYPSATPGTSISTDTGTPSFVVHVLKKAQLLARDLSVQFGERDARCRITGVEALTVMADNVVPAMLRIKGVLVLTKSAEEACQSQL